jgi:polyhydroxybutyrate depolymerase
MDCAPGRHVNELVSGEETRRYILHVPASYRTGKPVALVLGFHGNGGRAEQFEAYSGFSPLAEREGFIVVYLQGFGEEHPTWDVWEGSRDVQFARDLIDKIKAICSIDPARIYATGHSLGGGMTNRLACDLSERIAAIGPVSGAYVNPEPCSPSQPVAVVAVHGTADTNVFYNGLPPGGNSPETYFSIAMPIPQWASSWAQRNGCDAKSSVFFRKDPVSGQQWSNCRAAADVVLYTIRDGEHGWPAPSEGFDAAQMIWDFFTRHPLAPGG